MIEVRKLSKWYHVHEREPGFLASLKSLFHRKFRTVKAVDDVSFFIPEGEIVAFLGPNGAGKTTTMKVLTGLLHPSGGEVNVGGFVPFQHKKEFKKQISLVMGQKSQLIWDLPAAETFLVNKVIYEIPDHIYDETLGDLVQLLELEEVIRKPVRQLSLGERMKCELAAALLHRPKIVFLDEPTIGLDVNMQEVMRRFIQDYSRKYKATILLTSHYMADVTALCERVLVIGKGRLLYDGAIHQLIDKYAPNKRIRLQLTQRAHERELEDVVHGMGTIVSYMFPDLEVDVPREQVSELSARLLSKLNVLDLTIEDPSMESVIAQAFKARTEGGSAGA
ncbi:ATP-binding cassette domain-containing protein [Paenibacillus sp. CGMCC 1.16610]|uniref:ATP-binding cassette domain-containing protein n=1 Tax=Paenibacillus anseongense TaxID=2682845 RepID=A0ABW9UC61_9BACL|nr:MULTISPECIES: ATP-binding cassette domain-containing protein [Paenibacillus]MBA2943800.1 ATP-binding cassette domain-containing protein [Paenibacillus sp. CGMCC 1.16610]MVQ37689.1 ATP-binding cassette domain-containing protein [Paenibacillus anseongense]